MSRRCRAIFQGQASLLALRSRWVSASLARNCFVFSSLLFFPCLCPACLAPAFLPLLPLLIFCGYVVSSLSSPFVMVAWVAFRRPIWFRCASLCAPPGRPTCSCHGMMTRLRTLPSPARDFVMNMRFGISVVYDAGGMNMHAVALAMPPTLHPRTSFLLFLSF